MTDIAPSIDVNLSAKLRDKLYRRKFFWAESSARIAEQLIMLRKRRGLNQKQVADLTDTKQPAISRPEQADYQNWNLRTLRSIADALDARLRVHIEPSEDVLKEYESNIEGRAEAESLTSGSTEAVSDVQGGGVKLIRQSALEAFSRSPDQQALPQLTKFEREVGSAIGEELIH